MCVIMLILSQRKFFFIFVFFLSAFISLQPGTAINIRKRSRLLKRSNAPFVSSVCLSIRLYRYTTISLFDGDGDIDYLEIGFLLKL